MLGSTPLQQLGNTDKGAIYTEPFLTENGKLHRFGHSFTQQQCLGAWKYKTFEN